MYQAVRSIHIIVVSNFSFALLDIYIGEFCNYFRGNLNFFQVFSKIISTCYHLVVYNYYIGRFSDYLTPFFTFLFFIQKSTSFRKCSFKTYSLFFISSNQTLCLPPAPPYPNSYSNHKPPWSLHVLHGFDFFLLQNMLQSMPYYVPPAPELIHFSL